VFEFPVEFHSKNEFPSGGVLRQGRLASNLPTEDPEAFAAAFRVKFKETVWPIRNRLRQIWESKGIETRQRIVMIALSDLITHVCSPCSISASELQESLVPWEATYPIVPAEDAVFVLLKNLERLRVCANRECKAPYFFDSRGNRLFCSEPCARPAQREYKRAWWATHGGAWRKQREMAKKGGKKTHGRNLSKKRP
jgi:hypothetical protein